MRTVWILVLLAGCSLYLPDDKKKSVLPDAHIIDGEPLGCGPMPVDAGTCSCENGHWWCNTCPWPSPEAVIPCTQIGAGCEYEDWEHGCSCECTAPGWWSCTPETVGSYCPKPPPPDAGV